MQVKIVLPTLLAGLLALLLAAQAALAAPPVVTIRTGDHPGYGRVVFDLPTGVAASSQEANGRLVVRFEPSATATAAGPFPHNVRAITPVDGGAEIGVAPGAQVRITRLDGKLVVDVLDATPAASAPKPAAPAASSPATSVPKPATPAVASSPAAPAPNPAAVASPPAASAPKPAASAPAVPPALSAPKPVTPSVASSLAAPAPKPAAPAAVASPPAASAPKPAASAPPAISAPKPAAPVALASRAPAGRITPPLDRHDDTAPPTAIAEQPAAPSVAVPGADAQPEPVESLVLVPEAMPSPIDPLPPLEVGNIVAGAVLSLAATPQASPPGGATHAAKLPFDPGVGAAAFRRGGAAVIVFDERRPIDMTALHGDPLFAAAAIRLLPTATILRLPIPQSDELRLTRTDRGWTITTMPHAAGVIPALRAIRPEPGGGLLRLRADDAGQVVSVPDPDTGGTLLVGTQRQAGQAIAVARTAPEYALLPTWQGVVVEPVSDRLALHVAASGFVLHLGTAGQISLAADTNAAVLVADAHTFSRRYDFPALPAEGLRWRLKAATGAVAAAPARERGSARLAVAQAMVALGLGVEAQSVLGVAVADDGRLADNPDLAGLKTMAALLSGRINDGDFTDTRLSGTDEVALWHAVLVAMQEEGSPQAAPVFAAELPLLLSYPETLRDRLLPLAAETMALGGEQAVARQLLDSRKDDHALDLARAFLGQQEADPRPALELYDALAASPDRLIRTRAAVRAVELRLTSGALTAAQAADALDKLLYSWRGDTRELGLRQRIAELRRQGGAWRQALALLRDTAEIWPEQKPVLLARMADIFAEALLSDAETPLPPLELVTLAEENADLLPVGQAGHDLAARLADRLVALDLPRRAVPLLVKLADSAPAGPVRAAFGDRLASMRLAQGDPIGALTALTASDAPSLPQPLLQARTLTFARAAAAKGDMTRATAALAALGTVTADALRAELLESAKDWPAAEAALRDYAARTVPESGPLDEPAARTLLRLAAAAADCGDEQTLVRLREHDTRRLPAGKIAEMFRLITAGPVRGAADLPRASQESKLAGALPVALKALAP